MSPPNSSKEDKKHDYFTLSKGNIRDKIRCVENRLAKETNPFFIRTLTVELTNLRAIRDLFDASD
ncbi:hypothetical protein KVP40.0313 [Vibrio phage KVP40]|uniref:Uncharacterized protein n=2 Tax=Schizotequatrovirus KVP40 TaxID=1914019 RepID=Q6WHJ0_BPKVM|nr:hypothetical protein KVP40.0313 [Vibrio phage KVP40]AAQ64383.1 hypothetical protein KVP40.0313 [Vibrio phage KVP40]AFN37544.1 hypothetical protein pp2_311 [Vibrio phage phi-pp2]